MHTYMITNRLSELIKYEITREGSLCNAQTTNQPAATACPMCYVYTALLLLYGLLLYLAGAGAPYSLLE